MKKEKKKNYEHTMVVAFNEKYYDVAVDGNCDEISDAIASIIADDLLGGGGKCLVASIFLKAFEKVFHNEELGDCVKYELLRILLRGDNEDDDE